MDRMWTTRITGEVDECYIPDILLPSVPCCHAATGSLQLCTHNHKFAHLCTNTQICSQRITRSSELLRETPNWPCGIVTFLPSIPAPGFQGALRWEGHRTEVKVDEAGGAESQFWHVTWSNRGDLWVIGFHIGSMVLRLQNARHGSEIRLRL